MTDERRLSRARELLQIEARAITACSERLGPEFLSAIELIDRCRKENGKLIFMGMGKSHYVAGKLAASFMSMGTNAVFLHPAEALHGDLGGIRRGDLCFLISKSAGTPEILGLIPYLRENNKVIAITGNPAGLISEKADICLDASVEREACPINMLPTASTTAALAVGDALIAVIAEEDGFDKRKFAGFHPGGSIGKRLNQYVEEVKLPVEKIPCGSGQESLKQVASEMSRLPIGAFCVIDSQNTLLGILSDGDLKRILSEEKDLSDPVSQHMSREPVVVYDRDLIDEALGRMESMEKKVNCAPVVDENKRLSGFVRLHDLI